MQVIGAQELGRRLRHGQRLRAGHMFHNVAVCGRVAKHLGGHCRRIAGIQKSGAPVARGNEQLCPFGDIDAMWR